MILQYFKHILQAKGEHLLHSPFVFDFYKEVLKHQSSATGAKVEALRKRLARSKKVVEIEDYGAGIGGKHQPVIRKKVGALARRASRSRREGEFLYRLCQHYQPKVCVEFGTHLGISALYQMMAVPESKFITMDAAKNVVALAQEHFAEFGFDPTQLTGEFSDLLANDAALQELRPDYVFFDGNHRYEPTLEYFHHFLPRMQDEGIMVFDDIHWSEGMERAWEEIIEHPEVTVSVDLFFMGICFVRRPQAKEHFRFRFRKY